MLESAAQLETAGVTAASAAGEGGVSGAMASWTLAWSSSLAALGSSVGGTAANLGSAATAYAQTDATAIRR